MGKALRNGKSGGKKPHLRVDKDLLVSSHSHGADSGSYAQKLLQLELTKDLTSSPLTCRGSVGVIRVGTLLALFKPGPSRRGVILMACWEVCLSSHVCLQTYHDVG
jgi:hypothetical protein